jgi:archaellum component FlaC
LPIHVQIRGGDRILTPTLEIRKGDERRTVIMTSSGQQDGFGFTVGTVSDSFTYRISAGPASSPLFTVRVLRPPHVRRVDLRYEYPSGFGLENRVEEDGGDIYAPAGTTVRVRVMTDKPVASADMVMADGTRLPLSAASPQLLEGTVKVAADGSYRIALGDADGLRNPGDTEYFIRTLEDRPPEVRIVRPGGDQEVTPLQEVTIEARAEDDYGIARFELVYAVRGGREHAVPLKSGPAGLTATGSHTLYLEDLDVRPGDFVTYYARARDVGHGKKPTEARSDIFFLEVKPYDEEFVAVQSQQGASAQNQPSLEELAEAQKDIIVATWKLDRRALDGTSGKSAQDILQVARAQGELQRRARAVADQMRAGAGRGRGRAGGPPQAANATSEALAKAMEAMGRARGELEALKTGAATPHEMEALNQLLKANAENRRRQINTSSQQASSGSGGGNRSERDLSSLFDRELRRQEQTNYETPPAAQRNQEQAQSEALERVRDLARRQEALGQQQQDLATQQEQMSPEAVKRQLEKLTREQSELREQAEALARDLSRSPQGQGDSAKDMREASEQMRSAAAELRRNDPRQASENSEKALDKLNDLENQLRSGQPDERRRALGDLTLEARQLADAQRGIANEARRLGDPKAQSGEALRRLAGDEERLADRLQQMERETRTLAAGEPGDSDDRQALNDAASEMTRQQLERRMRESASRMREAAGDQGRPAQGNEKNAKNQPRPGEQGTDEKQIADALDALAKQLGRVSGGGNADSQELSDQLAQAQRSEQQMKDIGQRVEQLKQQIQQLQDSKGGQQGESDQLSKLQDDLQKALKEGERLMEQVGRSSGEGYGLTPQGQQLSSSAPGTESYKQDFSRWDSLKKNISLALEQLQVSLAQQLAEKENRERLNAGGDNRVPEEYRELVDRYYQSLAKRKP